MIRRLFLISACVAILSSTCEAETTMIEKRDFHGWPNTYILSNGLIEAAVVADVGPRIMSFRRVGGREFLQPRDGIGASGESTYVFRGGWRLWIAPERRETTYALDNSRCDVEQLGPGTLRVTGPAQSASGIQKIVTVSVRPGVPMLQVESVIRNVSTRPVTYAAWSLPVLRPGGRAFIPLDVGAVDSFDATRSLIFWSYARFDDPRYRVADRLVEIDHSKVAAPLAGKVGRGSDESKIGVDSKQGWSAYLLDDELFLKRFAHAEGTYGDGGSTIEVYSNHEFLELEHLGPLRTIAPGEDLVLSEQWWAYGEVAIPVELDAALDTLNAVIRKSDAPR